MTKAKKRENLIETTVTYSLDIDGHFCLIENVPARVNLETGEQFFSPTTVERIQQIIHQRHKPSHVVQIPVYNFLA